MAICPGRVGWVTGSYREGGREPAWGRTPSVVKGATLDRPDYENKLKSKKKQKQCKENQKQSKNKAIKKQRKSKKHNATYRFFP